MGTRRRIRIPTVVALAALAATAVALALVLLSSDGHYRVSATFERLDGVIEGGEVRAGGVPVGKVARLDLGRGDRPHAELEIDDDFRLREGARLVVRPFSLSSEVAAYIEIGQGDGPTLPDDAVIDRAQTRSLVPFDVALSTLDRRTRREVGRVLDRFDRATRGRGPDVERTLRHSARALGETAELAAQLHGDGAALRTLVGQGRRVVDAIRRDPGALGAMVDGLGGMLRTTAARQRSLHATVARMRAGLDAGGRTFDRLAASVPQLRRLVAVGRPGVRELRRQAPALRALMADARPALRSLDRLLATAPADLRRIRPLLPIARDVSAAAAPALRASNPIFNETRVRLPGAFQFFPLWGDFTASYDANGHGARVGLQLVGTPDNEIDGTNCGPGKLKLPFMRAPGALTCDPWRDYRKSFVEAPR